MIGRSLRIRAVWAKPATCGPFPVFLACTARIRDYPTLRSGRILLSGKIVVTVVPGSNARSKMGALSAVSRSTSHHVR